MKAHSLPIKKQSEVRFYRKSKRVCLLLINMQSSQRKPCFLCYFENKTKKKENREKAKGNKVRHIAFQGVSCPQMLNIACMSTLHLVPSYAKGMHTLLSPVVQ